MPTATLQPTDMSGWAPVTKHYETSDGLHLAVEASTDPIPEGAETFVNEMLAIAGVDMNNTTLVLRPTVILPCTADGEPTELTVLHSFPAGTSHEDALSLAGYTVD